MRKVCVFAGTEFINSRYEVLVYNKRQRPLPRRVWKRGWPKKEMIVSAVNFFEPSNFLASISGRKEATF